MTLSNLTVKYFKLAVGTLKTETPNKLACDCPLCGDTKGRLSVSAVNDEDGVVGCWNAGCDLSDTQMPLAGALALLSPGLERQYKRERFKDTISDLKGEKASLNDILNKVKEKSPKGPKESKEIERVIPTEKVEIKLPPLFDFLVPLEDIPEAVKYLEKRKIVPQDNWYYSCKTFVEVLDKKYYIEDFIFIPLIQYGKLKGFYTRSIYEKQFSTMIFPNGEKYWTNDSFNPNETTYIFESIFDAISSGLTNIVAGLGADLPQEFLDELKDPVFCYDLDKTGVSKSIKQVSRGYKVFVWPTELRDFKDMNEALCEGENNLKDYILENIHKGIQAQILLPLSLS